ncbi:MULTISPECIES: hypothetical protein [Bradyrhizobium]|uniref:hypothetical protein n=1 Tax=Bradyrhizobium TaxID=374 RepID=UPI00067D976F|nr:MULTISPECIES: hypothetical protein [Bradyrhizobium]PAY08447.1 hypothetical protein CK489_13575 [Bradyrhizobium sp. UFLA03-84]
MDKSAYRTENVGLQALDQPFHLVDRLLIDLRYAGLTSSITSNPVEALNLESAPCVDRVKVDDQRLQAVPALFTDTKLLHRH